MIPVALHVTSSNGDRFYTALDRSGKVVAKVKVYDCGHGAHLAHEKLKSMGFRPSWAEWVRKVVADYERSTI